MGRNGSGKTTLLKLIAGLIKPERGTIQVNGRDPRAADSPSSVAILFQNPDNQMVATTVEKEIAFGLENRAASQEEMEATITRLAEAFGATHLLGRITSELSGGEKQRVALAAVMVNDPAVLLLDEPDAFLDATGRKRLHRELNRLRADNRSLVEIRITQDPAVAAEYPRLVVMEQGGIAADGPPGPLLARLEESRRRLLESGTAASLIAALPSRTTLPGDAAQELAQVALDRVSFAYPFRGTVLEGITLRLRTGEIAGLVGPTGSGKTSLGLLLCGVLKPTDGTVTFLDRGGIDMPAAGIRGQVAAVLQQPERQFFLESCAREVAFGPTNLGRNLTPNEVDNCLGLVGLEPSRFRDRDPFSLSAGEKRRLAFATVLSMAPALVIFDEPTAGLDYEGFAQFVHLARALRTARVGQVIITHESELIRLLCDRVASLRPGGRLTELPPAKYLAARGDQTGA